MRYPETTSEIFVLHKEKLADQYMFYIQVNAQCVNDYLTPLTG